MWISSSNFIRGWYCLSILGFLPIQIGELKDIIGEIHRATPIIAPMGMFELGPHLIPLVNSFYS